MTNNNTEFRNGRVKQETLFAIAIFSHGRKFDYLYLETRFTTLDADHPTVFF